MPVGLFDAQRQRQRSGCASILSTIFTPTSRLTIILRAAMVSPATNNATPGWPG